MMDAYNDIHSIDGSGDEEVFADEYD